MKIEEKNMVDKMGTCRNVQKLSFCTRSMTEKPSKKIVRNRMPNWDAIPADELQQAETREQEHELYKKYDPDYYEYLMSFTASDQKALQELFEFIGTLTIEDHFRYVTNRSKQDTEMYAILMERDELFKLYIEGLILDYKEMDYDDEKLWNHLVELKEINDRELEKWREAFRNRVEDQHSNNDQN